MFVKVVLRAYSTIYILYVIHYNATLLADHKYSKLKQNNSVIVNRFVSIHVFWWLKNSHPVYTRLLFTFVRNLHSLQSLQLCAVFCFMRYREMHVCNAMLKAKYNHSKRSHEVITCNFILIEFCVVRGYCFGGSFPNECSVYSFDKTIKKY